MILLIAEREFLSNILTLRFLTGFVLCLMLIVSSTYILVDDYAGGQKAYDESIESKEYGVRVFARLSYNSITLFRPPSKLSFLCLGADKRMGNTTEIRYRDVPVEAMGGGDDPLMVVFPSLDMILIVEVILSLLALLFAYNTISGEREHGTLAQTLSNPIPRHQVLIGKFVGGMMSVLLPLLAGLFAGLIVVWFSGKVVLNADDWVRIGLTVFASLMYVSVFFTLGMLVSSLTGRSATSLMLLLFFWVLFVVLVPNISPYIAKQVLPIQDKSVVEHQVTALDSEMRSNIDNYGDKLRGTDLCPKWVWWYFCKPICRYAKPR